ncbi:hypothetical protein U14_00012 [Candidatus Moduliflexus flocculans]|uniref:SGNH hydrolase-type esterase domain-containing protein n=1 Tax=Candidatus Moduliflexus flocculans TaxID=1499966 RepID=A0A0S6VP92_9BACT|nr:hypothetical protein U14_00012 [Candidatus Moduliflexus flocculans]
MTWKTFFLTLLLLACLVGGSLLVPHTSGIALWGLLTGLSAVIIILLKEQHELLNCLVFHRQRPLSGYWNLLLVVCSVMLIVTAFEGVLQFQAQRNGEKRLLTLPQEWERYDTYVPGAKEAYYWHGKLHVFNEYGMRCTTPFTAKNSERCRIIVIGDSLTYGLGIAEEDTYTAIMQRELEKDFRVEVLNLGICTYQSEDIYTLLLSAVPQLTPDLVVYGVCLNDFLISTETERTHARLRAYAFPLPKAAKQFMLDQTLAGQFFERAYHEALMRLGLRATFLSNILDGLNDYQLRFTRDMTAMNFFVISNGLPPITAMVLDQYPVYHGRQHRVAQLAETILELARMNVIPTENYYKTYSGRQLHVSKWEGHPNEEANRIFAAHLIERLREHPVLQQYRK